MLEKRMTSIHVRCFIESADKFFDIILQVIFRIFKQQGVYCIKNKDICLHDCEKRPFLSLAIKYSMFYLFFAKK